MSFYCVWGDQDEVFAAFSSVFSYFSSSSSWVPCSPVFAIFCQHFRLLFRYLLNYIWPICRLIENHPHSTDVVRLGLATGSDQLPLCPVGRWSINVKKPTCLGRPPGLLSVLVARLNVCPSDRPSVFNVLYELRMLESAKKFGTVLNQSSFFPFAFNRGHLNSLAFPHNNYTISND